MYVSEKFAKQDLNVQMIQRDDECVRIVCETKLESLNVSERFAK